MKHSSPSRPSNQVDVLEEITTLQAQLQVLQSKVEDRMLARLQEGSPSTPELLKGIIRARRLRDEHLGHNLFADPAWDILLTLYQIELEQERIAVSDLCAAAAVPATTALRWIERLVRVGFIARRDDHNDHRRVWVELTIAGSSAMKAYFARLSGAVTI